MSRKCFISISFAIAVNLSGIAIFGQKVVTASQVNGTWREVSSRPGGATTELWIWALGNQQLQIEFSANNAAKGFSNTSVGKIRIEGTKAKFKPEEGQTDEKNPCVMTLSFVGSILNVTEKGSCGWGAGVSGQETYKKVSSAKPKFDSQ